MTATLTLVAVAYLGFVALVAGLTGLGAPLEPAMRTGFAVARVGAGLVALLDALTLVRGHRPSDPTTHAAYVVCVLVLPWLLANRHTVRGADVPTPWVVALASVATAAVLVRLAQTWA
jgi:hypothetical protein